MSEKSFARFLVQLALSITRGSCVCGPKLLCLCCARSYRHVGVSQRSPLLLLFKWPFNVPTSTCHREQTLTCNCRNKAPKRQHVKAVDKPTSPRSCNGDPSGIPHPPLPLGNRTSTQSTVYNLQHFPVFVFSDKPQRAPRDQKFRNTKTLFRAQTRLAIWPIQIFHETVAADLCAFCLKTAIGKHVFINANARLQLS